MRHEMREEEKSLERERKERNEEERKGGGWKIREGSG